MHRCSCSLALHARRKSPLAFITSMVAATVLVSCGGGTPVHASNGGPGHVVGLVVVSGPVATASITAYRLDATMTRGATLVSGTTKADGTFDLTIPAYNGHLEVVVTNGSYFEQAAGLTVQVTRDLTAVVPSFGAGSTRTITVSPISTVATALARADVRRGTAFTAADSNAWTHVNSHFGAIDWRAVVPTNLTPTNTVNVTMSDATKAGLVLASLSQQARAISANSGLSAGTSVTASTLGGVAGDDAEDGTLDGLASGAAVIQGTLSSTGQTFRGELAEAVLAFVTSPSNKTNLRGTDIWALATAMATNDDPYLFCPGQTACTTVLPPAPELRTGLATYYDERNMALASAAVPPAYQFPPGAPKMDPMTAGIYKAATRLMWTTQPDPEVLESANPDNVPFVQVRIPVGGTQLPLATINYAIDDGTSRYTGSLDPWKSPQSTITNLYYDLPLSANLVASLAGTGPSPRTLDLYITAADVNGTIASNIHIGSIAFHIVGPPVFVAEDTQYATYTSNRSTFGYTIGTHNYENLWDPSVTYFTNGMVRLVRYVISNPAPYALALQGAFTTTGTEGWRVTETWQRFNGGRLPSTVSADGKTFASYYCQCLAGWCSSSAPSDCRSADPCTFPNPFGHVLGSGTSWNCAPSAPLNYFGTGTSADPPFTITSSSTTNIATQIFANPTSTGDETTLATVADGYPVIPGAYGSTPGKLVLYVARPVALSRSYSDLSWNKFTSSNNRYEAPEQLAFVGDHCSGVGLGSNTLNCYFYGYWGAVHLKSTTESLSGTVTLTTRGLSGAFAVGETATPFTTAINVPSLSTH